MNSEAKKISFGFSKLPKKSSVVSKPPPKEEKRELIECLEGQNIKIKDAVEEVKGPLIIPLTEPSNTIIERIKESRAAHSLIKAEIKTEVDGKPDSELTLDELAARELLKEAQNLQEGTESSKVFALPTAKEEPILEGKKEPTLEDYENIPVNEFGFAALRGMGWKEGMAIGKNQKQPPASAEPVLRPKGMGLGANKMANTEKVAVGKDGKELKLVKGAYVKITAGHHSGMYCKVEGFDDEAGRVMVRHALTKEVLSVNEFTLTLVTKDDYLKSAKVINAAKFELHKQTKEEANSSDLRNIEQSVHKGSSDSSRRDSRNVYNNVRSKQREDLESSDEDSAGGKSRKSRSRDHKEEQYSSSNRKHKKSSKKSKRKYRSSSSSSDSRRRSRSRSKSRSKGHKNKHHRSKS